MSNFGVFIGYDEREAKATEVAAKTLRNVTNGQVEPQFLRADKLADHGLLTRISDHRGGQDYDFVSNAPKSTRFAISRFLTPILCQDGFQLFCDADVVFFRDPREMLVEIEPGKAVYVVKHEHIPTSELKMVNQVQTIYARKNWSSVALYRADHPSNRRLSLHDINTRPGRDLHRFYWLHDDEIGAIDPKWNWLVNIQPKPDNVGIMHMTLGGPWLPDWTPQEHDELWLAEAAR